MKAQSKVRGILIEGNDGHEYLLGFGPIGQTISPTFSLRQADGTFEPLKDKVEASKVAMKQVGLTGANLIGPGRGRTFFPC